MWKLIQILTIAVLVNGSYYSFNFAFWASGPNTKMILALFGLLWFLYDSWRGGKGVSIPRVLLGGAIFSILYSPITYLSKSFTTCLHIGLRYRSLTRPLL